MSSSSTGNEDPLSPQRRASVAAIVRRTHEMLAAARAEEWESLVERERERRPLIEAFFASSPQPHEAAAVAEFIREVQAIDAEVMALAERGKRDAAEALRLLANRHRVSDAYTATRRR